MTPEQYILRVASGEIEGPSRPVLDQPVRVGSRTYKIKNLGVVTGKVVLED